MSAILEGEECRGSQQDRKKGGVARNHENMAPGNSFPQICVVSEDSIVDEVCIQQEYEEVVAISNCPCLLVRQRFSRSIYGFCEAAARFFLLQCAAQIRHR